MRTRDAHPICVQIAQCSLTAVFELKIHSSAVGNQRVLDIFGDRFVGTPVDFIGYAGMFN